MLPKTEQTVSVKPPKQWPFPTYKGQPYKPAKQPRPVPKPEQAAPF